MFWLWRLCKTCLLQACICNVYYPCHSLPIFPLARSTDDNEQNVMISPADKNSTLIQQTPLILIAVLGGALLSLGNLTTQWSSTIYSTPLTTVLALQASMTVVLGTSLNYFLEPYKTKNPTFYCTVFAHFFDSNLAFCKESVPV